MRLLDVFNFKRKGESPERLIGRWKLIRSEGRTFYDKTSEMIFTIDGKLIYSIRDDANAQTLVMNLIYKLQGDFIVTDQPSSPRVERTAFKFDADNILVLCHEGSTAWFQRV